MSDAWVVFAVLIVLLASSAPGVFLQGILKQRHRSRDTIDAVRLVISILVTFTAFVLSLVTSSVKLSFPRSTRGCGFLPATSRNSIRGCANMATTRCRSR